MLECHRLLPLCRSVFCHATVDVTRRPLTSSNRRSFCRAATRYHDSAPANSPPIDGGEPATPSRGKFRGHDDESLYPSLEQAGVKVRNWDHDNLMSSLDLKEDDFDKNEEMYSAYHTMEKNQVLENCLSQRSSDQFTFNDKFIRQTDAEEEKHFKDFTDVFGTFRFSESDFQAKERSFVAHSATDNPELWQAVERTLPSFDTVPRIPDRDHYPSGFKKPTAKLGDYPYHVSRTASHMLPVYIVLNRHKFLMATRITRVDGNLFKLRDDLDELLRQRYHLDFISRVSEERSRIDYRGDFIHEFKEFLLSRGF